VLPVLLCEFQRQNTELRVELSVSDTQSVVELVADRRLELGIVGAARRHRSVAFEPFFRDEVILACPPGHPLAGHAVGLTSREGPLILMQRGAGVRQMVEDELRKNGKRLRDLEVPLGSGSGVGSERGAGWLGVGFISRQAVATSWRPGRWSRRASAGSTCARHLHRPRWARAGSSAAQAFVAFARGSLGAIVRWGLEELPGALEDVGSAAAARRRAARDVLAIGGARWSEVRPTASPVPAGVDGILAVGGGSAIDTAKPRRTRRRSRSFRPDHLLRRRVDGVLRRADVRPPPGRRRRQRPSCRDRVEPELTLDLPAPRAAACA
jgi:hypothetical protein